MSIEEQPGKKSYWFENGFPDIKRTVRKAWKANNEAARGLRLKATSHDSGGTVEKYFFKILFWMGVISVYVFGSVVTATVVTINFAIVAILMACVYVGFSAIWLIDRLYLAEKSIFTACHACKERSIIPEYKCPNCGTVHSRLVPSSYGILKRECTGNGTTHCGYKLPTNCFVRGEAIPGFNGGKRPYRKDLPAICGHCGTLLNDRESRPICIPVVGGRSVGKTAFIAAFSHDFITKTAHKHKLQTEALDSEKESMFENMERAYETSDFDLTSAQNTSGTMSGISSISFSFFVKNPSLRPDRLIHVYDIAGEYFTDMGTQEKEVQKQYEYCHGIVLVVDLLSIQPVYDKYEYELSEVDKSRRDTVDVTAITNVFINKLREVTGLSSARKHSVPLAVVITKTDAIPKIDRQLSLDAARALYSSDKKKFKTVYDAEDYLCRKFLVDNGLKNFLININMNFSNNRYFSCSPIGHTAMDGPSKPKGVMPVMEWLVGRADRSLGRLWCDCEFSKRPVGLTELR